MFIGLAVFGLVSILILFNIIWFLIIGLYDADYKLEAIFLMLILSSVVFLYVYGLICVA
jgi:hypothetical protein